ncbi:MAG: hypothetical protein EKK56_05305 [Flavobacteriaceae bacterium]|nr:MAG: hypothetical protein EKK56_05305 [Flavobacteriaceae bacterium]
MIESNRKFTIGKLEIRKFTISDYLYLLGFSISVSYYLYAVTYNTEKNFILSFFISWFVGFQTISSPFGLRFRNIYFSLIWLFFSSIFLIENNWLGYIPISTFILYHVMRIIFWKKYNKEFIPYQTGRGSMFRHKSFFEGRSGGLKDKKFTKILLFAGILIILFCFIQMIRAKTS